MASVWRHPLSKYWTACFRDLAGKQRRITTKETDRKRAQRLAEEYEAAVRTKRTLRQAWRTRTRRCCSPQCRHGLLSLRVAEFVSQQFAQLATA
jgi:hypothetical protein